MNHTYTLENLEHIVNKITDVKIRNKSRQRKYVIARHIFFKIAQTFVTPKISAITKFLKMHHASLLHHNKSFVRDIINDDYRWLSVYQINKLIDRNSIINPHLARLIYL